MICNGVNACIPFCTRIEDAKSLTDLLSSLWAGVANPTSLVVEFVTQVRGSPGLASLQAKCGIRPVQPLGWLSRFLSQLYRSKTMWRCPLQVSVEDKVVKRPGATSSTDVIRLNLQPKRPKRQGAAGGSSHEMTCEAAHFAIR